MKKLAIRKATSQDLMLYFSWANDVSVRQNAVNQHAITLDNHTQWFQQKVGSEKAYLYVFEKDNIPVGQVRFDINGETAEVDYSIDEQFRGQGLGKEMLSLGIEQFNQELPGKEIVGIVKPNNFPSSKTFERLGFLPGADKKIEGQVYKTYRLKIIPNGIVIVNSNPLHKELEEYFADKYNAVIINEKRELNAERLRILQPKYVFFPHWSFIIPASIYDHYECIVFHMTDLPYGRGGSPLQNLIVRGHQKTKISALRVAKGMDTGDIYLKKPLSLLGTAEEVFLRAGKVILEMSEEILKTNPQPVVQEGEVVPFDRRTPKDGDVATLASLDKVHDFIRMLDAEGYPNAYLETKYLRFEFTRSGLKKDQIIADVRIIKK